MQNLTMKGGVPLKMDDAIAQLSSLYSRMHVEKEVKTAAMAYFGIEIYSIWKHLMNCNFFLPFLFVALFALLSYGINTKQRSLILIFVISLVPLLLADFIISDVHAALKLIQLGVMVFMGNYLYKVLLSFSQLMQTSANVVDVCSNLLPLVSTSLEQWFGDDTLQINSEQEEEEEKMHEVNDHGSEELMKEQDRNEEAEFVDVDVEEERDEAPDKGAAINDNDVPQESLEEVQMTAQIGAANLAQEHDYEVVDAIDEERENRKDNEEESQEVGDEEEQKDVEEEIEDGEGDDADEEEEDEEEMEDEESVEEEDEE